MEPTAPTSATSASPAVAPVAPILPPVNANGTAPIAPTVATPAGGLVKMGMDTVPGFEALQRAAKMLSASDIVPQHYRNNMGNCAVALDIALRLEMSPILVMQHLYLVNGRSAWSGQFLIALANHGGRFDPLDWEWKGQEGSDEWGCRAFARDRQTDKVRHGTWITWKMVKAEGWLGKSGSKWQTMPEQMFPYRAASFWARQWNPEGAMGLPTVDEVADLPDQPAPTVRPLRPPTATAPPTAPPAPKTSPPVAAQTKQAEPAKSIVDTTATETPNEEMRWLHRITETTPTGPAFKQLFADIAAAYPQGPPQLVKDAYAVARKAVPSVKAEKSKVEPPKPEPLKFDPRVTQLIAEVQGASDEEVLEAALASIIEEYPEGTAAGRMLRAAVSEKRQMLESPIR